LGYEIIVLRLLARRPDGIFCRAIRTGRDRSRSVSGGVQLTVALAACASVGIAKGIDYGDALCGSCHSNNRFLSGSDSRLPRNKRRVFSDAHPRLVRGQRDPMDAKQTILIDSFPRGSQKVATLSNFACHTKGDASVAAASPLEADSSTG